MRIRELLCNVLCVGMVAAAALAQQPAVDPKADQQVRDMSNTLIGAKAFSVSSHSITESVLPNGQKVQFARNQKVLLQRPDKIFATVVGDNEDYQFFYDGKKVSILNKADHLYASTDGKSSIDNTLDMLATQYDMALPLADLVMSDPYKSLCERVRSGQDLGIGYVFDQKCRHLSFRQEIVDWEIWIDETTKLPAKIVITYKEQPGYPQFTAFLKDWNLNAEVKDSSFVFNAPADAKKVDFAAPVPATQPTVEGK